ncbi:2-phosphosulfolactate phosphatase [Fictibacillus enclensis]|uniref:2-phosphosulfolactate phosphatase n=1 Tax=Fictibacillus enclensis TaxID=1017270 RepID=UPI0025A127DD|nr:2-phosphosulfolactate phosphatase [Fictibacillus enclensis]MDM5200931.1 2-phosphosulfolactate phosphatase [Fictibacillus enclensis]
MKELKFEVAYMPKEIKQTKQQVCVLVDVLRATTAMVTMLDKGCSEIVLTMDEKETIEACQEFKEDGTLVCAEDIFGNVSEHAQFSPSLISIHPMEIKDKRVVLRTTNGTLAGITLWNSGIEHILVGSMQNAQAVMDKAVSTAIENDCSVTIVCAGRENGEIAALDDAYTAGVLLKYGTEAALSHNRVPLLKDSAKMSSHLLSVYSGAAQAFEDSGSGETMRNIQCEEDIAICAQENVSTTAPILYVTTDGNFVVKNTNEVIAL